MKTTAREIRNIAEKCQSFPTFPLTERECKRHDTIIECGRAVIAEKGFANITFAAFAVAMRIGIATLRRHFCDLDALLAHIVRLHLQAIAAAIGNIPADAPDPAAARRAAYLAYTRHPYGGFTPDHLLLTRDSLSLPADELEIITNIHQGLARLLAGPNCDCPERILCMLDNQAIEPADMEELLAKYAPPPTPAQQNAARAARAASSPISSLPWQLPEGPPGKPNTLYDAPPSIPWKTKTPNPIQNTA
jgi:AcrR family transcriptional regulator